MRHPKIVVLESDGTLASYLKPIVEDRPPQPKERRWLLRETRQAPACLQLIRESGPTVLVLKIGRHLVRELTFLDQAHAAQPGVPIVAVGDAEDATLMALALELGASYVLFPPQPRAMLADIVARLLQSAIDRESSTVHLLTAESLEPPHESES